MKAMILNKQMPLEKNPLTLMEIEKPKPASGQVFFRLAIGSVSPGWGTLTEHASTARTIKKICASTLNSLDTIYKVALLNTW